ncbi:GPP34 family phosphoprotein [Catenulispora yoronensis]
MADDFFLMVHDDLSGRPRLSDRILGLGLAGALLCELAILRAIDVEDGELTTSTDREDGNTTTAGADEPSSLTSELVREVRGEQRLLCGTGSTTSRLTRLSGSPAGWQLRPWSTAKRRV